jgi:hypothetical protein
LLYSKIKVQFEHMNLDSEIAIQKDAGCRVQTHADADGFTHKDVRMVWGPRKATSQGLGIRIRMNWHSFWKLESGSTLE